MSLTSGFFNSLNHDRKYNAIQMSSIFDGIIRDGVFMSITDKLMVEAESGMTIVSKPGRAWFDHTWTLNDAKLPLVVDQSELILDRIDAVVLEVNKTQSVRSNTIKMVKGTPSATPKNPTLTKSLDVNQYPLAYVSVKHGVTEITQADITNMIGTSECPFVTGILETMSIDDLVAQWKSEWEIWITEMKQSGEDWQNQVEADFESWSTQQKEEFTQFVEQFEATMQIFQTNSEEAFNKWFASVKDILDENTAGNLLNLINEIKDGLPNATATHNGSVVAIVSNPTTAKSIYFYAPSNFLETDTYTLNGLPLTITDLNNEPIFNAWKAGSPVSLIIKGNVGFFKSGGGGQNDTLPPMVTNLKAVGGDQSITVSWVDPVSDAHDGTAITYKTESYPKHPYDGKRIDAKRTQKTVIGFLQNGTEYFIRAFPYNAKKQHQTLEAGSMVTCTPNKGPAMVTELKITGGGSRPTLSWINPVDDPLYHETVVVKTIDTPPVNIDDGEEVYRGTGTEVTLSGLSSYTNYYFGVFTISDTGLYRGPAVTNVYRFESPGPVTNFKIEGTGGSPVLSWKNPVDDELYVATVVVRKEGSKPTDISDGTEIYRGTGETITDSGLQSYTEYYYGVYTIGEDGHYQNPVFSDKYYFEFPSEPTEWSEVTKLTNSREYTFPEVGWFKVVAVAGSGNGASYNEGYYQGEGYKHCFSGGSGGSGGISVSKISTQDYKKINIIIGNVNNRPRKVTIQELSMVSNPGGDSKIGTITGPYTGTPSRGGSAGNAKGGNIENINGNRGNDGLYKNSSTGVPAYLNGGNPVTTKYETYKTTSGRGGRYYSGGETTGTTAYVVILRGNTNTPSPSTASTLSLLPTDSALTVDWENSGDPVQTGTMLVYNTNHVPASANDGISVDIPVTQAVAAAFTVDGEEQQVDNKKQSYTITGLANNKPVYVALFPYDANKKYGIPKTDVEIPREVTWYDTEQELKQELQEAEQQAQEANEKVEAAEEQVKQATAQAEEAEAKAQEATEQAAQAQSVVLMTCNFLPDAVALTMPSIYPEWDANSVAYTGKDKATESDPADIVRYQDLLYRCIQSHTSQGGWNPKDAVSLWVRIADPAEEYPEWIQPTGAHDAYEKGAKVTHNGKKWTSNVENNVWEPGVFGWDEVVE